MVQRTTLEELWQQVGIQLTPPTAISSFSRHGRRLPANVVGIRESIRHRPSLSGLPYPTSLAARFCLSTLRGSHGLGCHSWAVCLWRMSASDLGDRWNDLSRHAQAPAAVV